jgi:hypothetical protein
MTNMCAYTMRVKDNRRQLVALDKLIILYSTIKPTNALYFLIMSINPTYVSAAIESSSGFKVTFTSTFTVPFGITTYTPQCMSRFC